MADEAPEPTSPETTEPEKGASVYSNKLTIAVKVYAPFKVYYEGLGYSVSAINETGPFDVLPHHHNFLTMLVPCNLVIQTPEGEKVIKISRALMHVKADSVVVFVDV